MSETSLNVFERFCDGLPETVRDDLLFMKVMLSGEEIVVEDIDDIDERARALFGARTFVGRMGNLITAVSIVHVYFAMDLSERFGSDGSLREYSGQQSDLTQSRAHNHYADRRRVIVAVKQVWVDLRRTTLSPQAIATALIPVNATPHDERSALG
jgi:hypothetical protein